MDYVRVAPWNDLVVVTTDFWCVVSDNRLETLLALPEISNGVDRVCPEGLLAKVPSPEFHPAFVSTGGDQTVSIVAFRSEDRGFESSGRRSTSPLDNLLLTSSYSDCFALLFPPVVVSVFLFSEILYLRPPSFCHLVMRLYQLPDLIVLPVILLSVALFPTVYFFKALPAKIRFALFSLLSLFTVSPWGPVNHVCFNTSFVFTPASSFSPVEFWLALYLFY